jgi:hypothetical protein
MNPFLYVFSFIFMLSLAMSVQVAQAAPDKTEDARAWVKRGQTALKDGELREALLAFESAERYQPSLNHKMMIAKVYESMPKNEGCLRAINTWHSVLSLLESQKSALIPKAKTKIQDLERSCTRQISVTTEPSGIKVWVDEELVGFSPLLINVKSDASKISVEYQKEKQSKTLDTDTTDVSFKLIKAQDNAVQVYDHQATKIQTVNTVNVASNHQSIKFQATLKCRAMIGDSYEDLSSCQSRALWEGDQFKLAFESDQTVYIYVFLSNSTGQRQTLFPRGNAKNILMPNQQTELPLGNQWFTLDEIGPVTEKIYIVYAKAMVPAFEALRTMNTPSEQKPVNIKTLAMSSVRGVVLPKANEQLKLSVSNSLDNQSHFIGRDKINRVEFQLFHQGARPK